MTPEDTDLCARLRQPFRSGEPVNDLCADAAQRIEALAAEVERLEEQESEEHQSWKRVAERAEREIAVLRRLVRAADYFVQPGQDSRYDEHRKALVEFDMKVQEGK